MRIEGIMNNNNDHVLGQSLCVIGQKLRKGKQGKLLKLVAKQHKLT